MLLWNKRNEGKQWPSCVELSGYLSDIVIVTCWFQVFLLTLLSWIYHLLMSEVTLSSSSFTPFLCFFLMSLKSFYYSFCVTLNKIFFGKDEHVDWSGTPPTSAATVCIWQSLRQRCRFWRWAKPPSCFASFWHICAELCPTGTCVDVLTPSISDHVWK